MCKPSQSENPTISESEMIRIWQELLSLDNIDRLDDFFAIGGTSLHAAQLFAEFEDSYGVALPITALLQAPTVRELTALLCAAAPSPANSLVLLKDGDMNSALFLFHPIGGTVLIYRELADALKFPGRVYGLQAVGISDGEQPHTSVEEMANDYCDLILSVQPAGSYQLAGYSAGGILAFATAHQLIRNGRRINYLGLINTHFSFRRIGAQVSRGRRFLAYLDYVRCNGIRSSFTDFSRYRQYQRKLKQAEARLDQRGGTPDSRREKLAGQIIAQEIARGPLNQYSLVQQLLQIAIKFYQPDACPASMTLYKIDSYHLNRPGEIGWARFAARGLKTKPISGSHTSLLEQPEVKVLAAAIDEDIGSC